MRALLSGGGVYGTANAVTAGVQFAIILMFANALTPAGFGMLSMFSVLFIVLSMTIGLGLSASAQRSYFEMDTRAFRTLLSTILKAMVSTGLGVAVLAAVVPDGLIRHATLPRPWILLTILAATAQTYTQTLLVVLQTRESKGHYLGVVALQMGLLLMPGAWFRLSGQTEWQVAIVLLSSAYVLAGIASAWLFYREGALGEAMSQPMLRRALKYSGPLVPHQVAGWAIAMFDRFIIATHFGVAQAGVYSFSFQIAQGFNIISMSFNQAFVPLLFRSLATRNHSESGIVRMTSFFVLGLLGLALTIVVLFVAFAPAFLRPDYVKSLTYVPWLIAALYLLALSRVSSNYLMFYGRTAGLAMGTIVSGLVSVVMNYALIPRFGVIAACWTSVCSFALFLLITAVSAVQCHVQQTAAS